MSGYVFWFHYNKPASNKAGGPKLTVHFKKTCYIVDEIECNVKTFTHERKDQPRIVVKGKCSGVAIISGLKTKCIIS